MRGSSLATRLFVSATAWVVVILAITGVILSSVYRDATERAFDRRLNLYLRTLIAEVATPDEPPDRQFQSLGQPLFDLPLSGWYWQITRTDTEKRETRASRSLWDKKLPKLMADVERGLQEKPITPEIGTIDPLKNRVTLMTFPGIGDQLSIDILENSQRLCDALVWLSQPQAIGVRGFGVKTNKRCREWLGLLDGAVMAVIRDMPTIHRAEDG